MGRKATGSVDLWRGRWRARCQGELVGLFDAEDRAWRAIDAWLKIEEERAPLSVRGWFDGWFDERETARAIRGVGKERSVYAMHIRECFIADMLISRVRPIHIQRLIGLLMKKPAQVAITFGRGESKRTERRDSGRTLSQQTIKHIRRILRDGFEQARIEGKVAINPVTGVRIPRMDRVVEDEDSWSWLTLEEIDQLFRVLPTPRLRALFAVAIYAGLRDGELLGLRWQDVELSGKPHLKVRRSYDGPTKTKGSRRSVPLLEPLHRALAEYRKTITIAKIGQLVFPADHGGCYSKGYDADWSDHPSAKGVRDGWRSKARIRSHVRFHDLRHTCGSHLVQGSWGRAWTLHEVMQWLGHSDIKTTLRYASLSPQGLVSKAADLWNESGTAGNDDT
jgi:integrase